MVLYICIIPRVIDPKEGKIKNRNGKALTLLLFVGIRHERIGIWFVTISFWLSRENKQLSLVAVVLFIFFFEVNGETSSPCFIKERLTKQARYKSTPQPGGTRKQEPKKLPNSHAGLLQQAGLAPPTDRGEAHKGEKKLKLQYEAIRPRRQTSAAHHPSDGTTDNETAHRRLLTVSGLLWRRVRDSGRECHVRQSLALQSSCSTCPSINIVNHTC